MMTAPDVASDVVSPVSHGTTAFGVYIIYTCFNHRVAQ